MWSEKVPMATSDAKKYIYVIQFKEWATAPKTCVLGHDEEDSVYDKT
jgi:hypothetical protein